MVQSSNVSALFRVPQQTLEQLSFSGHSPKKIAAWADGLPRANLGEMARMLYSGIQELNQLRIDSLLRVKLLEEIRPSVYYVCNSLKKHYLNQPIILPEKAAKVANLAQALQAHMATGYKIVVVQNMKSLEGKGISEAVAQAIHRAISDMTSTLFRCNQLYFPTPANLWVELNRLYLLAEQNKLLKKKVVDREAMAGEESTIMHVYARACLLPTTKPNQLRQSDIGQIYQLSAYLAKHVDISGDGVRAQSFVVNLLGNFEPVYRSLTKKSHSEHNRFFDCSNLMVKLEQLRKESGEIRKDILIAKSMSEELMLHLSQVWNSQKQRTFNRTEQAGRLEIGVGMSVSHYLIANRTEFDLLLRGGVDAIGDGERFGEESPNKSARFKEGGNEDVWSHAFDAGSATQFSGDDIVLGSSQSDQEEERKEKYPICKCQLVNTSPGGYCINLSTSMPGATKSGELLVVKEGVSARWNLGVIRWAKRFSKENVRIGVELIASQVTPIGVKLLQKTGEIGNYMRALLLPELKALEQPMTIIVPNIAFQMNSKVMVNQCGTEIKIQLQRLVTKTASFSQFELKILTPNQSLGQVQESNEGNKDDFDSIWSSL